MADSEQYAEPGDGYGASTHEGGRRRSRGVKKPPVPVLPDGTWVRIGDSCRSSTLQGQVGTVVAWGRQVNVFLRGPGGSEGAVRKINPTDLIALSEEPEFTAAEPEQVTGEAAAPARTSARAAAHAPTRGVRSTPLGKPAGAVTDEVWLHRLASPAHPARLETLEAPVLTPPPTPGADGTRHGLTGGLGGWGWEGPPPRASEEGDDPARAWLLGKRARLALTLTRT